MRANAARPSGPGSASLDGMNDTVSSGAADGSMRADSSRNGAAVGYGMGFHLGLLWKMGTGEPAQLVGQFS